MKRWWWIVGLLICIIVAIGSWYLSQQSISRKLWEVNKRQYSDVAVSDGLIYTINDAGELQCYDKSAELAWRVNLLEYLNKLDKPTKIQWPAGMDKFNSALNSIELDAVGDTCILTTGFGNTLLAYRDGQLEFKKTYSKSIEVSIGTDQQVYVFHESETPFNTVMEILSLAGNLVRTEILSGYSLPGYKNAPAISEGGSIASVAMTPKSGNSQPGWGDGIPCLLYWDPRSSVVIHHVFDYNIAYEQPFFTNGHVAIFSNHGLQYYDEQLHLLWQHKACYYEPYCTFTFEPIYYAADDLRSIQAINSKGILLWDSQTELNAVFYLVAQDNLLLSIELEEVPQEAEDFAQNSAPPFKQHIMNIVAGMYHPTLFARDRITGKVLWHIPVRSGNLPKLQALDDSSILVIHDSCITAYRTSD
jgi:hypothetical protein